MEAAVLAGRKAPGLHTVPGSDLAEKAAVFTVSPDGTHSVG
jgi:hypothetical protein